MIRDDQKAIVELVAPNARVIDIGCGEGELLAQLEAEKQAHGHGLELESERVSVAVAKGLSVVQGNADTDLVYYPDDGFDIAILGQTLQVMKHPKEVLQQALRIAEQVIVVIPNFGHIHNRFYLAMRGRMPVSARLPYQWYETPNIHFCTIKDMVALARELNCVVEKRFYLDTQGTARAFVGNGGFYANLFGEYGVFMLKSGKS